MHASSPICTYPCTCPSVSTPLFPCTFAPAHSLAPSTFTYCCYGCCCYYCYCCSAATPPPHRYACPIKRSTYDELAEIGGAIGWRLRNVQRKTIEDLWRRACSPPGAGRRGLPGRCSHQWFCDTFCGGLGAERTGTDPIWDLIKSFNMYDSVALLAAVPVLRDQFFEPSYVARVPPLLVGGKGEGGEGGGRARKSSTGPENSRSAEEQLGGAAPVAHTVYGLAKDDSGIRGDGQSLSDFLENGYNTGATCHRHRPCQMILMVQLRWDNQTDVETSLVLFRSMFEAGVLHCIGIIICAPPGWTNESASKADAVSDPHASIISPHPGVRSIRTNSHSLSEDCPYLPKHSVHPQESTSAGADLRRQAENIRSFLQDIGLAHVPVVVSSSIPAGEGGEEEKNREGGGDGDGDGGADDADECAKLLELYKMAPATGVVVAVAGTLGMMANFIQAHPAIFQQKTRSLVVIGGVDPATMPDPAVGLNEDAKSESAGAGGGSRDSNDSTDGADSTGGGTRGRGGRSNSTNSRGSASSGDSADILDNISGMSPSHIPARALSGKRISISDKLLAPDPDAQNNALDLDSAEFVYTKSQVRVPAFLII